jgi:general secretion pathway protein L
MKKQLRLALPELAGLVPDVRVDYALLDRNGTIVRSGQLPLNQLGTIAPGERVYAVLHPNDAVVTTLALPALSASRLRAAVHSSVEPMVLGDPASVCIAHGPRRADGRTDVAWADRRALAHAWNVLAHAGLNIQALLPLPMVLPANDACGPLAPLCLPADHRWQAPLPTWSLAVAEIRPVTTTGRWRSALGWAAAALTVWVAGLNIYAFQLRHEMASLQTHIETTVSTAFPAIGVLLDPVLQAQRQLDSLRQYKGQPGSDHFMQLANDAAGLLTFAQGQVLGLNYNDQRLSLRLAHDYTPPADLAGLQQRAAQHAVTVQRDSGQPHVWHVQRIIDTPTGAGKP